MNTTSDPAASPSAGIPEPRGDATWCDHLHGVEEFKALLRDLLTAYARAIPHPIGSGPEAITRGEAAVKAQVRVVEAYAFAHRSAVDRLRATRVDAETGAKLVAHARKFIADNHVSCSEAVYQTDRVIENAYEFIEGCANLVGYHKYADDE